MEPLLEIKVNGEWTKVTDYIFRSWSGPRRINGVPYRGPVYILGTTRVYLGKVADPVS